jgi:hypothetical protein
MSHPLRGLPKGVGKSFLEAPDPFMAYLLRNIDATADAG